MDKTNLFESILANSETHVSKIKESKFNHIAEAVASKGPEFEHLEYVEVADYDYSEDGYMVASFEVDDTPYSIDVSVNFTDVDVETDCDCDEPCDYGRTPDNIVYKSTGAWCEGVTISADYEFTLYDDGDPILEEVTAEAVVDFLTGKGVAITLDELTKAGDYATGIAEGEYEEKVNDDPSYFCDCDNCDCDDCDCDRWE